MEISNIAHWSNWEDKKVSNKCQEYMKLNQPCASEEHANPPVGLCVRYIKQKLKVVVVTRGKLEQNSHNHQID